MKEKKGTCKFYWKRFDHGIMKPIFIHKFDEIDQKRDLQFFEGFMKEGNNWAQEYRQTGDMHRITVKRKHSVISRSSEEDENEEPSEAECITPY